MDDAPGPEPTYTLFKHNLDEEFNKFFDQLYGYLPEVGGKLDKYFVKLNTRPENNTFHQTDPLPLLPELSADILRNPSYFENQKTSRFKPIFEEIFNFEKVVAKALEVNMKSAENIEITRVLFEKIAPFCDEMFTKFAQIEPTFDVSADSDRMRKAFDDTAPVLKQLKKAVYKVQGFELVFGLPQETMLEKLSAFNRSALEIEDVRKLYASLAPKLKSLTSSVQAAAQVNLERKSKEAVG